MEAINNLGGGWRDNLIIGNNMTAKISDTITTDSHLAVKNLFLLTGLINCIFIAPLENSPLVVLQQATIINIGKAIVLSLLLIVFDFGVYLEYVLALPYVGYLAFFANSNWASGISASAPIFRGMTIWVMIPVTYVNGSYTGTPAYNDRSAPTQDADDL